MERLGLVEIREEGKGGGVDESKSSWGQLPMQTEGKGGRAGGGGDKRPMGGEDQEKGGVRFKQIILKRSE